MKDPIDFHIRSLEQRIDDLTEENAALTEHNAKLKGEIEEKNKVNAALFKQVNFQEEIKSDNKRLRSALESLANMSLDTMGRAGCTYGDTDFDSLSAVHGYNCAVESVNEIASKALRSDQPKS